MRSPEAKKALASVSNDAVSLHESFHTALNLDESTIGSNMDEEVSSLDRLLNGTNLYQRALARQQIDPQQRGTRDSLEMGPICPSLLGEPLDLDLSLTFRSLLHSADPFTDSAATGVEQERAFEDGSYQNLENYQRNMYTDGVDPATTSGSTQPVVQNFAQHEHRNSIDSQSSDDTLPARTVFNPTSELGGEGIVQEGSLVSNPPAEVPLSTSPLYPVRRSRLPTLSEVLTRKTSKPYGLYEFYVYMRDIQKQADYLDFW